MRAAKHAQDCTAWSECGRLQGKKAEKIQRVHKSCADNQKCWRTIEIIIPNARLGGLLFNHMVHRPVIGQPWGPGIGQPAAGIEPDEVGTGRSRPRPRPSAVPATNMQDSRIPAAIRETASAGFAPGSASRRRADDERCPARLGCSPLRRRCRSSDSTSMTSRSVRAGKGFNKESYFFVAFGRMKRIFNHAYG